eukprot:PhM_4_TR16682/c0_g1_i1/m.96490
MMGWRVHLAKYLRRCADGLAGDVPTKRVTAQPLPLPPPPPTTDVTVSVTPNFSHDVVVPSPSVVKKNIDEAKRAAFRKSISQARCASFLYAAHMMHLNSFQMNVLMKKDDATVLKLRARYKSLTREEKQPYRLLVDSDTKTKLKQQRFVNGYDAGLISLARSFHNTLNDESVKMLASARAVPCRLRHDRQAAVLYSHALRDLHLARVDKRYPQHRHRTYWNEYRRLPMHEKEKWLQMVAEKDGLGQPRAGSDGRRSATLHYANNVQGVVPNPCEEGLAEMLYSRVKYEQEKQKNTKKRRHHATVVAPRQYYDYRKEYRRLSVNKKRKFVKAAEDLERRSAQVGKVIFKFGYHRAKTLYAQKACAVTSVGKRDGMSTFRKHFLRLPHKQQLKWVQRASDELGGGGSGQNDIHKILRSKIKFSYLPDPERRQLLSDAVSQLLEE